jgi:hypothetical protein
MDFLDWCCVCYMNIIDPISRSQLSIDRLLIFVKRDVFFFCPLWQEASNNNFKVKWFSYLFYLCNEKQQRILLPQYLLTILKLYIIKHICWLPEVVRERDKRRMTVVNIWHIINRNSWVFIFNLSRKTKW